jgi:hypothetical protein
MIKSSLISDAASMPLHWIYDQTVLAAKLGSESAPFYPSPSCPFYSYPPGVFSPYGDESFPLLRSIANEGHFDRDLAASDMFDFFATYPTEGDKGYAGRLNHAPKQFVAAREAGKAWDECAQEDTQANGITKVPLIVARYAGQADLAEKIESMVRILQNTKISIDSSVLLGKLLERLLLSALSPHDAIDSLLQDAAGLNTFQRNILAFTTSSGKISHWVAFSEALDTVPANASDAHQVNRIKGQVLGSYLRSLDLTVAIQEAPLSAGDKEVVGKYWPKEVRGGAEAEAAVLKMASAIGISCTLPGRYGTIHHR